MDCSAGWQTSPDIATWRKHLSLSNKPQNSGRDRKLNENPSICKINLGDVPTKFKIVPFLFHITVHFSKYIVFEI